MAESREAAAQRVWERYTEALEELEKPGAEDYDGTYVEAMESCIEFGHLVQGKDAEPIPWYSIQEWTERDEIHYIDIVAAVKAVQQHQGGGCPFRRIWTATLQRLRTQTSRSLLELSEEVMDARDEVVEELLELQRDPKNTEVDVREQFIGWFSRPRARATQKPALAPMDADVERYMDLCHRNKDLTKGGKIDKARPTKLNYARDQDKKESLRNFINSTTEGERSFVTIREDAVAILVPVGPWSGGPVFVASDCCQQGQVYWFRHTSEIAQHWITECHQEWTHKMRARDPFALNGEYSSLMTPFEDIRSRESNPLAASTYHELQVEFITHETNQPHSQYWTSRDKGNTAPMKQLDFKAFWNESTFIRALPTESCVVMTWRMYFRSSYLREGEEVLPQGRTFTQASDYEEMPYPTHRRSVHVDVNPFSMDDGPYATMVMDDISISVENGTLVDACTKRGALFGNQMWGNESPWTMSRWPGDSLVRNQREACIVVKPYQVVYLILKVQLKDAAQQTVVTIGMAGRAAQEPKTLVRTTGEEQRKYQVPFAIGLRCAAARVQYRLTPDTTERDHDPRNWTFLPREGFTNEGRPIQVERKWGSNSMGRGSILLPPTTAAATDAGSRAWKLVGSNKPNVSSPLLADDGRSVRRKRKQCLSDSLEQLTLKGKEQVMDTGTSDKKSPRKESNAPNETPIPQDPPPKGAVEPSQKEGAEAPGRKESGPPECQKPPAREEPMDVTDIPETSHKGRNRAEVLVLRLQASGMTEETEREPSPPGTPGRDQSSSPTFSTAPSTRNSSQEVGDGLRRVPSYKVPYPPKAGKLLYRSDFTKVTEKDAEPEERSQAKAKKKSLE